MVNLPLVQDKLALRLVAYDRDDDGYVYDAGTNTKNANSEKDYGFRGGLLWRATDRLDATLTLHYDHDQLGDAPFYNPALGLNVTSSDAHHDADRQSSSRLQPGLGEPDLLDHPGRGVLLL
jgi:hypothetical protein